MTRPDRHDQRRLQVHHLEPVRGRDLAERCQRDRLPNPARADQDEILGSRASRSRHVAEHQVHALQQRVAASEHPRQVAGTGRVDAAIQPISYTRLYNSISIAQYSP